MTTNEPIKLVPKDCGRHYGTEPGPCRKCGHHDRLRKKVAPYKPEDIRFLAALEPKDTP